MALQVFISILLVNNNTSIERKFYGAPKLKELVMSLITRSELLYSKAMEDTRLGRSLKEQLLQFDESYSNANGMMEV